MGFDHVRIPIDYNIIQNSDGSPIEEKAAKSHYVIENNGTSEELKFKVTEFVNWLKEREDR